MKLIIDIPDKVYNEYREGVMSMENNCIISNAVFDGTPYEERPQGECEKCDFRKFTETFIDGIVDVMNKNGITSVEQLSEILKGGAEEC